MRHRSGAESADASERKRIGGNGTIIMIDRNEYRFYIVLGNGLIESGWEYREDAMDRKRELHDDGIVSYVRKCKRIASDDGKWHIGKLK